LHVCMFFIANMTIYFVVVIIIIFI